MYRVGSDVQTKYGIRVTLTDSRHLERPGQVDQLMSTGADVRRRVDLEQRRTPGIAKWDISRGRGALGAPALRRLTRDSAVTQQTEFGGLLPI